MFQILLFAQQVKQMCIHRQKVQLYFLIIFLTLYKPDTSLRWTLEASPEGVHLRESWLYPNSNWSRKCLKLLLRTLSEPQVYQLLKVLSTPLPYSTPLHKIKFKASFKGFSMTKYIFLFVFDKIHLHVPHCPPQFHDLYTSHLPRSTQQMATEMIPWVNVVYHFYYSIPNDLCVSSISARTIHISCGFKFKTLRIVNN